MSEQPWLLVLPAHLAARVVGTAECALGTCWLVAPNPGNAGYLRFTHRRHTDYAHRVAYVACRGPVPGGQVVDHGCRNRACVNPAHLEAVTQRENVRRGLRGRLITECPKGHPYDDRNTLRRSGWRRCRTCHAQQERERAARRAA